jgi:hypothetical protein
MQPNLFDIAMRIMPRQRAWMFSSVTSSGMPRNTSASAWRAPSKIGSIETTS